MTMLRIKVVLIAAGWLLASPVLARAASPADQLASYDWSATKASNLVTNPPPKDLVAAFIATPFLGGVPPYSRDDLCSFRFADLRHSGNLSLVIDADSSGRKFCGSVYIIDKTPSELEVHEGGAARGFQRLDDAVQDLAGDGHLELVLPAELTGYQGATHCIATWPVIFAWTGTGYTNVSGRFPDFYEHQIEVLNQKIAALPPHPEQIIGFQGVSDCLEADQAKIQRVLGDPDAGLDQAIALAGNPDPVERNFAADLLADIGTPEASGYLRRLSKDPDKILAEGVTMFLATPRQPGGMRRRGKYLVGPLGLTQFVQYPPIPIASAKAPAN